MDGLQARAGSARSIQWMAVTAVLMGMNVALSSFGVPVPGGHLYLCDVVICTAAVLLDPLGAFIPASGLWERISPFATSAS